MSVPRDSSYIWVTWITGLLAGDKQWRICWQQTDGLPVGSLAVPTEDDEVENHEDDDEQEEQEEETGVGSDDVEDRPDGEIGNDEGARDDREEREKEVARILTRLGLAAHSAVAVAPEYLEAALAEMRKEFGTVEHYFAEGLGLDAGAQQALRAALVERA